MELNSGTKVSKLLSINKEISLEIIRYIAKQVGTVPKALKLYALRSNTSRDHIES